MIKILSLMSVLFVLTFLGCKSEDDSKTIKNGMVRAEVEQILGKACDSKMVPFKDNSGVKHGKAKLVIYANNEKANNIPDSKFTPCQRFKINMAIKKGSKIPEDKIPPYPKLLRAVYFKDGKVRRHEKLRY